jgi:hypothetical protein
LKTPDCLSPFHRLKQKKSAGTKSALTATGEQTGPVNVSSKYFA